MIEDKVQKIFNMLCVNCEYKEECEKDDLTCDEFERLINQRTEQDIIDEFIILGYKLVSNNENQLVLNHSNFYTLIINKKAKGYLAENRFNNSKGSFFDMREHKLLNELFNIYGWL